MKRGLRFGPDMTRGGGYEEAALAQWKEDDPEAYQAYIDAWEDHEHASGNKWQDYYDVSSKLSGVGQSDLGSLGSLDFGSLDEIGSFITGGGLFSGSSLNTDVWSLSDTVSGTVEGSVVKSQSGALADLVNFDSVSASKRKLFVGSHFAARSAGAEWWDELASRHGVR